MLIRLSSKIPHILFLYVKKNMYKHKPLFERHIDRAVKIIQMNETEFRIPLS